jgi:thiamine biosynthesis lipoprotein
MTAGTGTGLIHVEHVMGMAVSIDVRDDVDPRAVVAVVEWLHRVDATYSTHRPDSPISRFGRGEIGLGELADLDGPPGPPGPPGPRLDVLAVLARCEELHADTDGVFDVLAVPAPNGTRFDPSGFVKGWAIERATALLEAWGARNLCLNAGGDLTIRGEPAPGRAWRVGIRDPQDPLRAAAVLELSGRAAVATSGTYERGAHIVDPATGQAATAVAGVTVVGVGAAADLGTVDAYATTLFVLADRAVDWLGAHHPELDALVIDHDGAMRATPGLGRLR